MNQGPSDKKIILAANLQGYFFDGLLQLNRKSLCPIPESILYYSSDVLDKFALSQDYFEIQEGRVREKILGTKLLEASQLERVEQKRVYKEVADMSLIVCGYFSPSVNRKIIDANYYSQIGKTAYGHLNQMIPAFMDIPCFYSMLATSFESLTTLISLLAEKNRTGQENNLLFRKILAEETVSDQELLISGVMKSTTRKVS